MVLVLLCAALARPERARAETRAPIPESAPSDAIEPEDPLDWSIRLAPSYRWSHIEGYFQIPKGGATGTGSHDRPTTDELRLDDMSTYAIALEVAIERFRLLADVSFGRASGENVLDQDLAWRDYTFESGDRIESELEVDTQRILLGIDFRLPCDGRITPFAGAGMMGFRLGIADAEEERSRSFRHGAMLIGASVRFRVMDRLTLGADAWGSLPIEASPVIMALDLLAELRIAGGPGSPTVSLTLGAGGSFFDFEDKQAYPNHVRLTTLPSVLVGLSITF